jgi:hypothetical protein
MPITLSDALKAEIEKKHQFLVNQYLESCPPRYSDEPFSEIPKASLELAKQCAYEDFRDNFENHNNWICSSEFSGDEYDLAKKQMIEHMEGCL